MSDKKHVLFVCTGNTCRSPMAEALFRKAVEGRNEYVVGSAGVAASKGTPASPETTMVLKKQGATLDKFGSRLVNDAILSEATHVFAMTRSHLQTLESRFPQHSDKFYLVCEFVDLPKVGSGADVPDPIGMGARAYQQVAETFNLAIPTIVAYIDQTWKPQDSEG
ncbi:MAG: low molecular weight protein arginine phosphatase [Verrucomicrobiaceae bacterium]|nr:MAG: low molecular weight protein arginine phosphatase [Verrucomicrobiaceae bacterium]